MSLSVPSVMPGTLRAGDSTAADFLCQAGLIICTDGSSPSLTGEAIERMACDCHSTIAGELDAVFSDAHPSHYK